jgi:AraC family transcriptional regulator of adaptative response / DNA-3-methyladenine glycosylase II
MGKNGRTPGTLARAAIGRIDAGALEEGSVDGLARALGVTSRHLRRTLRAETGLSPIEIVQSRRLALARELVAASALPMTEIVFASGFRSVRRFHEAFAGTYGHAPSSLRRSITAAPERTLVLRRPGIDATEWKGILSRLAKDSTPGVESVSGLVYCRTARLTGHDGWLALYPGRGESLSLEVSLSLARVIARLTARVESLIATGEFDAFETDTKSAIKDGARPSLRRSVRRRFAEMLGRPAVIPFAPLTRMFPSPRAVAAASDASFAKIGIGAGQAAALRRAAQARLAAAQTKRKGYR